ncbi:MAG: broad specificity phosphatase PhoE [Glaciecola sp.]|jgi:broad specificity phosphatase PhoE
MAQMVIVRHAQASFGADDYDKLSDLGHQQALLLGDYFAARKQTFDLVVTGDMLRHKQTATGILGNSKQHKLITDAGWDEFDFENIVSAYLRVYPQHKPASGAPRGEWYKVLKKAMLAWSKDTLPLGDGETWAQFCGRVQKSANFVRQSEHKNVLVVTSGGAMAVFLMALLNTSVEQAIAFNLQIKNTSVNQFYFNSAGYQLNSFNNVPHLDTSVHLSKITYS